MKHGQSNPFATKFVNAGRMAFIGFEDRALDHLAKKLIEQQGNGQITGPHGVGKTTLTHELETRVARLCGPVSGSNSVFKFVRKTIGAKREIRFAKPVGPVGTAMSFGDDDFLSSDSRRAKTVLVLDGVERLSWFERLALLKTCQRTQVGLLLTSHRRLWGVRTLLELTPDFRRFELVVDTLTSGLEFQLSPERLRKIFTDNDGDMREA